MERTICIKNEQLYKEDYQMKMLRENAIEGLLPVMGRGVDQESIYEYDIGGKKSMEALYQAKKISGEEIHVFLSQMFHVLKETEEYLLNIHHIVLEERYIFKEKERFYFCYLPTKKESFWESFHVLSEFFVRRADYKDTVGVRMIFLLHKETMEENYSIEKLLEECEEEIKGETIAVADETKTHLCEPGEKEDTDYAASEEKKRGFLKRKHPTGDRRQRDRRKWGSWEVLDTLN